MLESVWEEFVNQLKAKGVETTVANTHDSKVDLANEGEVRYGDKGHPLSIFDELRNKRISSKRSPVERCFSVMKTVFRARTCYGYNG